MALSSPPCSRTPISLLVWEVVVAANVFRLFFRQLNFVNISSVSGPSMSELEGMYSEGLRYLLCINLYKPLYRK